MAKKFFLSYARGDDGESFDPDRSFVARLHRDLQAHGFEVWYDRDDMPSRRLTFHQEIRDAIAACDRLLLIVGPKAAESDYVRQEWQFAWFEADKVVTPILRQGDYDLVSDELKLLHCEDFRDEGQYTFHLKQLVRVLKEEPPPLGKLIGVPALPPQYLTRSDRLLALRDAVRAGLDQPVPFGGAVQLQPIHGIVAAPKQHVGMHGMGGIGKSVLAKLLARDRNVRESFSDGVVWVGLGSLPDLRARMAEVHRALGGDGAIATEHEGKVKLAELLQGKAVLLILDDAWRKSDIDAFHVLGPRCRMLVTTRDARLLIAVGGVHHLVELLTDQEALRLLATAVDVESETLPAEAHEVLAECGRLPLAVALAGGMVRGGIPWGDVRDALREHELEFLEDPHAESEQHVNLWRTIEVSVRVLDERDQQRLAELAVFPEDELVPESAVCTLWQHTGGLSQRHARKLLVDLKQRSLIQLSGTTDAAAGQVGHISLHDLIHDFAVRLARQQFGNEVQLHHVMLEAYGGVCSGGWWTGPNDGYFLDHLRTHLVAAGRDGELGDLLLELRWLETKNAAGLALDLPHDFRAAIDAIRETDERRRILTLLDEALRRDLHFIDRHRRDYPQGLFQCLWNTCWWYDCPEAGQHYEGGKAPGDAAARPLSRLLERWREEKDAAERFPWLRSLRPPSIHLGTAQQAVFRGHEDGVTSVAFSPHGTRIASGSRDKTVRVWDVASGAKLACLEGHDDEVTSVVFSADGTRIASGSKDKSIRVWDAVSGAEVFCLFGHSDWIRCLAISPDGRWIASGSIDETVWVWDAVGSSEVAYLKGHMGLVSSVAFSPNGMQIVSGSWDTTVRVWDATNGTELACLRGHNARVFSVAFSSDKTQIASGSGDHQVRVWDATSGAELACMRGHNDWVWSVAFSPNGTRIASGSEDMTVRVWDSASGAELACLRGHEDQVSSVAFSPDGTWIASGSSDRTVRVWDAASSARLAHLRGHEEEVWSVAFSPDGMRIASGSYDKTVRVWDAASGAEWACLRGHENWVTSVVFSPDGTRIASGSHDKTVRVWDATNGAELACLRGHENQVASVAFSPGGARIATVSADTVRVWDAASGAELACLRMHENWVTSVAFSPGGARIATVSDDTVRVWDAANGAELACLKRHENWVTSVAFSPDGARIATVSDNTVRVWDAASGECLEVIAGRGDVVEIAVGEQVFPLQALNRDLQTVVEQVRTGHVVARFPGSLPGITTHPSGRCWVGGVSNYLCLLYLENPPPPPS
jgi:WD40 repeat protein